MYYQNYEDYIRSILGYPITNDIYTYENSNYYYDEINNSECNLDEKNVDDMYPEIYKKINPIVCNKCDNFNEKITKEALDNIVENIYSIFEQDNEINISFENRNTVSANNLNKVENRQIRPNNPLLRDLIKILVLNRLFRRPRKLCKKTTTPKTTSRLSYKSKTAYYAKIENIISDKYI